MQKEIILAVAAAIMLSGCSATAVTNTAAPTYASIPTDLAARVAGVSVLDAVPAGGSSLGSVRAQACQRLTSDPLPTNELAIALLKEQAIIKGGNAILTPKVSSSAVSISGNCWSNIAAIGEAFKL